MTDTATSRNEETRTFAPCSKCGFAELSVSYHGPQHMCHPLGSNDPCWDYKWDQKEHLSVSCRRCSFRRVEEVNAA